MIAAFTAGRRCRVKRNLIVVATFALVFLLRSSVGAQGINTGLIAYYPFDGNANDASGNGHHGVVYGATLTNDRYGNTNSAYRFDGIDDMIVVQENGDFNVGAALTISLWIRFLSTPPCDHPTSFVSKSAIDPFGSNTGYIFPYIGFSNCSAFGLIVNTNGPYAWDFARSFSYSSISNPFDWHFYAATYDGTVRRVYLDGSLVSVDGQFPPGMILQNSNNLVIGNQYGTLNEWAHAEIDDIRIYKRALTADEILELFRDAPTPVGIPTLTEWGTIALISLLGIVAAYHLPKRWMTIR